MQNDPCSSTVRAASLEAASKETAMLSSLTAMDKMGRLKGLLADLPFHSAQSRRKVKQALLQRSKPKSSRSVSDRCDQVERALQQRALYQQALQQRILPVLKEKRALQQRVLRAPPRWKEKQALLSSPKKRSIAMYSTTSPPSSTLWSLTARTRRLSFAESARTISGWRMVS